MEIFLNHCEKCKKMTKNGPDRICFDCGYKKQEESSLDFIKTQEVDLDLLK